MRVRSPGLGSFAFPILRLGGSVWIAKLDEFGIKFAVPVK